MSRLKTIIADKQILFTQGLVNLLKASKDPYFDIINVVDTAKELESILKSRKVDLLLMELNFPDRDGLSLLPEIRESIPSLRICILSHYGDHRFVKDALQNGADGYLTKKNDFNELVNCIEEIMLGNTYIANGLRITPAPNGIKSAFKFDSQHEDRFLLKQKLTKREQEVLELITKAMNNKEIAKRLFISDQTVGVHRKNIMRKLGVRNTVNLIKFAFDHHLV